ncbi:MAG: hypothetical protein HC915_21080 [Anaerolineae bacterium]|nr:hypothetical protein [Anaerolineae bacterium]
MEAITNALEDFRTAFNDQEPVVRDGLLILLALVVIIIFQRLARRFLIAFLKQLAKRSSRQWDDIVLSVVDRPLRLLVVALSLLAVQTIVGIEGSLHELFEALTYSLTILAALMLLYQLGDKVTRTPNTLRAVTALR